MRFSGKEARYAFVKKKESFQTVRNHILRGIRFPDATDERERGFRYICVI